jgi:hypothetical protein
MGTGDDVGRRILFSVLVPALVSAATAVLVVVALAPGEPGPTAPARSAAGSGRAPPPVVDLATVREESRKAVEELKEAIAVAGGPDLRAAVREPGGYSRQLLDRLDVVQPEQHLVVTETIGALARIGDPAVPEILSHLRGREFPDADRGYGSTGPVIRGGTERMWLLDALRQIGTPAAKEGLLTVVRESGRLTDYRDLFALYYSTSDEQVIEGIAALLPSFLAKLEETGIRRANDAAPRTPDVPRLLSEPARGTGFGGGAGQARRGGLPSRRLRRGVLPRCARPGFAREGGDPGGDAASR